ncbi:MAG TPA: isochorismatase family protein [Chloroflexota bacterium]|jgi:nicotinamidase-related amidase
MAVWDDVLGDGDRRTYSKGFDPDELAGFGDRPAVLVVDMSRAFAEDGYPTGDSLHGQPTVAAISRLLTAARRVPGLPIFFVTYSARELAQGWSRWKGAILRDPRMRADEAFQIVDQLRPEPGERVIVKTMPSAFFGTPLASLLTFHQVDTVLVTGMVTSGCVRATVVDAFSNNFRVVVPEECVADRGELSHKVNLFDIHMKYGDVRPLGDVLAYLETCRDRRQHQEQNGNRLKGEEAHV